MQINSDQLNITEMVNSISKYKQNQNQRLLSFNYKQYKQLVLSSLNHIEEEIVCTKDKNKKRIGKRDKNKEFMERSRRR